jgi:hypothetical protein
MSLAVTHDGSDSRTMSRSPTIGSDDTPDAARTLTDLSSNPEKGKLGAELPAESTLGAVEKKRIEDGEVTAHKPSEALSSLPNGRKNLLLLCFCLSMFM